MGTTRNLIWLGEDEHGTTEAALKVMSEILRNARDESNKYAHFANTIKDREGAPQVSNRKLNLDTYPELLIGFYSRPWFRRLWVRLRH